jgi:hypothetical protein
MSRTEDTDRAEPAGRIAPPNIPAQDAPAEERMAFLADQVRRLSLDNEDLRFDCARLRATIAQNQVEAAALARRNAVLQRHVDVLHRFTAWRHTRLFRFLVKRLF